MANLALFRSLVGALDSMGGYAERSRRAGVHRWRPSRRSRSTPSTGCLNTTFYASAEACSSIVCSNSAGRVTPEFIGEDGGVTAASAVT